MNESIAYNITKLFDVTGLTKYQLFTNKYVQAIALFLGLFIIINIILYILKKYITRFAKKTKFKYDDILIEKTEQPVSYLLYIIALRISIIPLLPPEVFLHIIDSLIIIVIAYIFIKAAAVFIDAWGNKVAKKTKSDLDDELLPLMHKSLRLVVILIALMFVLDEWGVQIGPLLASLGIAGIAVAFALQETLGNIFGGVSIIVDKTIRLGDVVKLESGDMGEVVDIGLRSTKIKNFDGELLIVPNSQIANMKLTNWAKPNESARFRVRFGVEYGSDIEKVKKIAEEEIKKVKEIAKDPAPQVIFTEMADFSLNFECRCWVDNFRDRVKAQEELTTRIYNALNKHKINIPFPTHTVYLEKE